MEAIINSLMQKLLLALTVIMISIGLVFAFSGPIFLLEPENNSWTNENLTDFRFYFQDPIEEIAYCKLVIDDLEYGFNDTVFNNTETIIQNNQTLENGVHDWLIQCTNQSQENSSETRILGIDRVDPELDWPPIGFGSNTIWIVPLNTTVNISIVVNGTISPWEDLNINISNCGGDLQNESEWDIIDIDETTSEVNALWATPNEEKTCYLFADAQDKAGNTVNGSLKVLVINISAPPVDLNWSENITPNPIPVPDNGRRRGGGGGRDRVWPDTEPPSVRLISPIDESIIEEVRPTFKFYVNDNQNDTLECILYIGSMKIPSLVFDVDREVIVDAIGELNPEVDLDEETYNWRVECRDNAGNLGVTDSWFFTIKLPMNITGAEELEMNVTAPSPLSGAAIADFFRTPVPWVGILALSLLILFWLLYKKLAEEEIEE